MRLYPNIEIKILVRDGLDIEANRGYCRYDFANLYIFSDYILRLPLRLSHFQSV
jgi:hypothetical protein